MKISYADLLSGDSILIEGIGHVHSPHLYELKPTTGIGYMKYSSFVNLFAWDKERFIQHAKAQFKALRLFEDKEQISYFDMLTLLPMTQDLLREAMSFFIDETVTWDDKERNFVMTDKLSGKAIGKVDRKNFETLANVILQLNYVTANKTMKTKEQKSSKTAESRWEKAQEFLAKQSQKKKQEDDAVYSIGNIISKLCSVHNTYNLLNVYELTVFQLYDQFAQYCLLHDSSLSERIFTIHGGNDFKPNEWMKQINNI